MPIGQWAGNHSAETTLRDRNGLSLQRRPGSLAGLMTGITLSGCAPVIAARADGDRMGRRISSIRNVIMAPRIRPAAVPRAIILPRLGDSGSSGTAGGSATDSRSAICSSSAFAPALAASRRVETD